MTAKSVRVFASPSSHKGIALQKAEALYLLHNPLNNLKIVICLGLFFFKFIYLGSCNSIPLVSFQPALCYFLMW